MSRSCKFPGCKNCLSGLVPDHIEYCGKHQQELHVLRIDLAKIGIGREDDVLFVFQHPEGCSPRALAIQIGTISERTMRYYVGKDRIKTIEALRGSQKSIVPQVEIIRVLEIYRAWVLVTTLVSAIDADYETFKTYTLRGEFGPYLTHPSNVLVLESRWLDNLEDLASGYKKLTKKAQKTQHYKTYKFLLDQGLVPSLVIESTFEVQHVTVKRWTRIDKILPYEVVKGMNAVKKEDLVTFAQRAVSKEINLSKKVTDRCQEYLNTRRLVVKTRSQNRFVSKNRAS